MRCKFVICSVVFFLCMPVWAQVSYTPLQLREMVKKHKYPKQGPVETKTQDIDYDICVAHVVSIVESVKPDYPTSTIVNTKMLRMEKIWTNDAAVTMSCSAPDKKMVMTSAKYN